MGFGMTMRGKRRSKSGLRGVTRLYAVQTMYKSEFEKKSLDKILSEAKHNPETVISEELSLDKIDLDFFTELMEKVGEHREEVDKFIEKNIAKNWSFDRLDKVMLALLRLGVCEIVYMNNIPTNVSFSEYIEVAKAFFKKKEVGFINGILNSVYIQQKPV